MTKVVINKSSPIFDGEQMPYFNPDSSHPGELHEWEPLCKEYSTTKLSSWNAGSSVSRTSWPFRELVTHVYCRLCLETKEVKNPFKVDRIGKE